MKVTALALALGLVVCALTAPANAAACNKKPSINKIEHKEQARIRQGIRSGELTRGEAARLEAEQAKIRVEEEFARMDGDLSRKERQHLYKDLHQASRDIYCQKYDKQDR